MCIQSITNYIGALVTYNEELYYKQLFLEDKRDVYFPYYYY
jgi:hypothetical protein